MAFLCTWKSLYKRDGTATTCSWKRKVSGFAIVLFVEIGTFVSLTPNLLGQPPHTNYGSNSNHFAVQ